MYNRTSCKRPPNKLTQRLSGHLQKSNHRAPLLRRGLGTSTLWKIIYCMQFLGYAMCNYMLLKFMSYIPRSMVHTANKKIRECIKAVAYKRLRTMLCLCLDWRSLLGGGRAWRFNCTSLSIGCLPLTHTTWVEILFIT